MNHSLPVRRRGIVGRVADFADQVGDEPAELVHGLVIDLLGSAQGHQDRGSERVQPVLEFIDLAYRRLLAYLITAIPARAIVWAWSRWRRTHQHRARTSHYQRRQAHYHEVLLSC
jgi:hypothetical protein